MGFVKHICKSLSNVINCNLHTSSMACSRYEYVKNYELDDRTLPNVWMVIRVDGKGFTKFTKLHEFEKPNDKHALNLMSSAAIAVMEEFRDIIIGYGQSDEYSFVFRKTTDVYKRRSAKLLSYVTSLFSSAYVFNWRNWFPNKELKCPPCFDGRVILYPSDQNLKDYLSWRQADVHVNNLYNTAFWKLILEGGLTNQQAEEKLRGTLSTHKNELLFTNFGINYNDIPAIFRKGTILLRKCIEVPQIGKKRQLIVPLHQDMINEEFWKAHPELLGKYSPPDYVIQHSKGHDSKENVQNEILYKQFEKLAKTE